MKPSRLFAIGALVFAILVASWWTTRGEKVVSPGTLVSGAKSAPKGVRWMRPASLPAPVEPETPSQLAGRVVDLVSGEPIAGAEVSLRSEDGDVLRATDSGADGGFRFETVGAARLIAARAGGYAFFVDRLMSGPAPDPAARVIELEPAVRVQGKVVGPDGAPVSGAEVTIEDTEGDDSRWPRPASDAVTSGIDGSFDVHDAPSGSLVVWARKDGFAPGKRELDGGVGPGKERAGIVVQLESAHVVTGRVVDDAGHPVSGAAVRLHDFYAADAEAPATVTDRDGGFRLAGALSADSIIFASKEAARGVAMAHGEQPVTIVLRPARRVAGDVVDAGGAPVAGADVMVQQLVESVGGRTQYVSDEVRSGADGRFETDELAGRSIRVSASAGAAESGWQETWPGTTDVRLVLRGGHPVSGRIVDERGAPITSPATVLGRRQGGGWTRSWRSEGAAFQTEPLGSGEWQFTATAPGHATGAPVTVSITIDIAPPPLTLSLGDRGTVKGTLVDRDTGEPIAGARVSLAEPQKWQFPGEHSARLDWGGAVRSDAKGRFTLPARAGAEQLFVYHPEYRPAMQPVSIPDAGDVDVGSIDLVPGPGKSAIFEFSGIGAVLAWRGHACVIQQVFPNTPAEGAGLRTDDVVLEVDGQATDGLDLGDIVSRIRGPVGTVVSLAISRNGNPEPLHVDVVRQQLKL